MEPAGKPWAPRKRDADARNGTRDLRVHRDESVRECPAMPDSGDGQSAEGNVQVATAFDFDAHRRRAVDEYEAVRDIYEECAQAVRSVLKTVLEIEHVRTLSIEARAKDVESFGKKSIRPSEDDPDKPRYADPLRDITDLSGARVITFLAG
jgi:hypothetical protein